MQRLVAAVFLMVSVLAWAPAIAQAPHATRPSPGDTAQRRIEALEQSLKDAVAQVETLRGSLQRLEAQQGAADARLRGLETAQTKAASESVNVKDALTRLEGTQKSIESRTHALEDWQIEMKAKSPQAPWWLSILLAAIAGFVSAYFLARRAETRADRLRKDDKAADYIAEFGSRYDTIAKALGVLEKPEHMRDAELRNIVLAYGNLLDLIALAWRDGDVNTKVLRDQGIHNKAKAFWSMFDTAAAKMAAATPPLQLASHQHDWRNLQWLATDKGVQDGS
ncbi:MAG: hypothetical protein QOJ96_466 [Alphaproteobacteria bacterium]|nr:hypothetical protein [Alphaproteobacteria bacterium]